MRYIHTGFYSLKALNICQALLALQKKENNHHAKTFVRRSMNKSRFEMDSAGEVVMAFDDTPSWRGDTPWRGLSDSEALLKTGCFFKQRIMDILAHQGKTDAWDRKNELEITVKYDDTASLTFTIKDAYYIYDMFLGRRTPASRYSEAYLNAIRGTQRDPITTEMINSLKEEIASLEKTREEEVQRLGHECWQKANEASSAVRAEYEQRISAYKNEMAQKISELEASIKETIEGLANS